MYVKYNRNPTDPFPISGPLNLWIGKFYVVQERRATDFKSTKFRKAWKAFTRPNVSHFCGLKNSSIEA